MRTSAAARVPLSWGAVSRTSWSPAVPVILLTGYLGAGKTSLLNHLLRDPDSRVGVVVNDFGDLNVDAGLVAGQVDEPLSIAGGCVCCLSDTSALEDALVSLADPGLELDAIVVEASGIAEPLTLARMVSQWGRHRFHLAGVVDVVDALMHGETVDTESLPPVRYAATTLVVVNKLDAVPVDDREAVVDAIRARVHQRNPRVLVTGTVFGRLDPTLLLDPGAGTRGGERAIGSGGADSACEVQGELPVWDLLREEYSAREAAMLAEVDQTGVPHRHARSVTVQVDGCVNAAGVLDFVEDPPAGVYRAKGRIAVLDGRRVRRYVVQAVGPSVYVSRAMSRAGEASGSVGSAESAASALVVIGEDFDEDEVQTRLRAAMAGGAGGADSGDGAAAEGSATAGGEHDLGGGMRTLSGLDRLDRYVRLHS